MINAKTLRNTYFPKDDTAFVDAMNDIEKQIIAAAEEKEESVIVVVPTDLKKRIKEELENEDYTVSSSAVTRDPAPLTDGKSYITVFWSEDLVFMGDMY